MDLTPHDDRPDERRQRTTLGGEVNVGRLDPGETVDGTVGLDAPPPPITEAELWAKLEAIGVALNRLHHPDGTDGLWLFHDDELDAIAGPGARELNKRGAMLRRLLEHLDLVAVVFGFVAYLGRQLDQLRAIREAEGEAEAEAPAEPEHVGPEAFGLGDFEAPR